MICILSFSNRVTLKVSETGEYPKENSKTVLARIRTGRIRGFTAGRLASEIVRNTFWQNGRPLRVADPETAFEDLRHVGRNIHMVDMETYHEVVCDRDSVN